MRTVSSTHTFTTSAWNPPWSFVTVSSPLENAAVRTSASGFAASNGSSSVGLERVLVGEEGDGAGGRPGARLPAGVGGRLVGATVVAAGSGDERQGQHRSHRADRTCVSS